MQNVLLRPLHNKQKETYMKGRCINAKQGRYAINGFKKLDSYKEER
ncbi:hypothetical protein [Candidatus Bandiella numerosa]|nr:hypothetical protein [Candidatus Bandiella numerosa]